MAAPHVVSLAWPLLRVRQFAALHQQAQWHDLQRFASRQHMEQCDFDGAQVLATAGDVVGTTTSYYLACTTPGEEIHVANMLKAPVLVVPQLAVPPHVTQGFTLGCSTHSKRAAHRSDPSGAALPRQPLRPMSAHFVPLTPRLAARWRTTARWGRG